MGPVEAGEGLELLLAKQAAIDCGGPLEALYLRLTLFLFRSCKDLLNNRDHAHFKQGLWKAYQLGFEGQAHCPPSPFLSQQYHLWSHQNAFEDSIQLNISQLQLLPKWKVNQVQEAKRKRLRFFTTPAHNKAFSKQALSLLMIPTGQSLTSNDSYSQKQHCRP